jgi:hypothetical protein
MFLIVQGDRSWDPIPVTSASMTRAGLAESDPSSVLRPARIGDTMETVIGVLDLQPTPAFMWIGRS